ncbi:MAG: DUF1476 domain-containing protein [Roseiarcus sp.]|jgi:hypothetical protein
MSGVFDTREESFEKRFVMGEELRFKARARRNKLIGLWAAQLLGYQGDAAKARANELVEAQVGRDDDEALAAELRGELSRAGVAISAHRVRRKIDAAMAQAVEDIEAGR